MKRKYIKMLVATVIIILVSSGGFYGYKKVFASKNTTSVTQYVTMTTQKGKLDLSIQGTGSAYAAVSLDISPSNNGTLKDLSVNLGDKVTVGQQLFSVENDEVVQALNKAKSSVDKQNLTSVNNKNTNNNSIATATVNVNDAQVSLNAAVDQVNKMTVTSPERGTVVAIAKKEGESLQGTSGGGQSSGSNVAVLTIQSENDGSKTEVNVNTNGASDMVLQSLKVSVGSVVNPGDTLFVADSYSLRTNVIKAQNNLDKQNLALTSAQNSIQLMSDKISGDDLDVQLKNAQQTVDKLSSKSPINGLVVAKNFKNDDAVTSDKPVLTIIDSSSMKIKVAVDELNITKVKQGEKAEIVFDALTGKTYEGKVEEVALTGTSTNNVTTYDVVIGIINPEGINVGMNCNVNILLDSKENILTVPTESIVSKGGKKYILTPKDSNTTTSSSGKTSNEVNAFGNRGAAYSGETTQVEVTTGLETEKSVEILTGLKEGDKVLLAVPQTPTAYTNSTTQRSNSGAGGFQGAGGNVGAGNSTNTNGAAKTDTTGAGTKNNTNATPKSSKNSN